MTEKCLLTTSYVSEVTRGELKECANNTNKDLTDVKASSKDTREDTKKIKELIENLAENVSNTDKANAERFTQMKEYFLQLTKGSPANPEVPTHGELYFCFCILNSWMNYAETQCYELFDGSLDCL